MKTKKSRVILTILSSCAIVILCFFVIFFFITGFPWERSYAEEYAIRFANSHNFDLHKVIDVRYQIEDEQFIVSLEGLHDKSLKRFAVKLKSRFDISLEGCVELP